MPSRLETIQMNPLSSSDESLAACLGAILSACGTPVPYDELITALGTAFMVSYAPDAPAAMQWDFFGRHAFLVETAQMYGLELRGLHPPDAAPAPPLPREFDLHYHDSYLPLIRTSLARDEPLLAWMGWATGQADWGVITSLRDDRCAGITPVGPAELIASPVQIYQFSGFNPPQTNPDELLDTVIRRARIILGNQLDPAFQVITGPRAIQAWRPILAAPSKHLSETHARNFKRCLQNMVDGRLAVARIFANLREVAAARHLSVIEAWLETFETSNGGLLPWRDAALLDDAFSSDSTLAHLKPLVDLMEENEAMAAEIVGVTRG